MFKRFLFLVFMLHAMSSYAEIYSCKKPSGETEFSDTPCKAGSSSEVVPDRDHLTEQQQDDAQRKLEQQKNQANDLAAKRSAAEPVQETQVAPPAAPADDVYVGGGCNDVRAPRSNCAGDLNRMPIPDVRPRPVPRPRPR